MRVICKKTDLYVACISCINQHCFKGERDINQQSKKYCKCSKTFGRDCSITMTVQVTWFFNNCSQDIALYKILENVDLILHDFNKATVSHTLGEGIDTMVAF